MSQKESSSKSGESSRKKTRQLELPFVPTTKRTKTVSCTGPEKHPMEEQGIFEEIEGNLFSSSASGYAHCVSADMRLGKGIAKRFATLYGGIGELKAQKVEKGGVAVLKRGEKYIFNLVTKDFYYEKPTMETLRVSLNSMVERMHEIGVSELAVPRLGCGLDGLRWSDVRSLLKEIADIACIKITVFSLPPKQGLENY